MKKYLVELTLLGSNEVVTFTLYAKDFDGAYLGVKETRNLDVILTLKEL